MMDNNFETLLRATLCHVSIFNSVQSLRINRSLYRATHPVSFVLVDKCNLNWLLFYNNERWWIDEPVKIMMLYLNRMKITTSEPLLCSALR